MLIFDKELSTQQTAEILQVSRPYVIKILEEGQIPYHMVGSHRRIRLMDLIEYKKKRDAQRSESLSELIRISEETGLYEIHEFPKED